MGEVIFICENCSRARATKHIKFETGYTMKVCTRCEIETDTKLADLGED